MSEEQEKYYDRILWESRLAQGLIEPDAPITPDPIFDMNNKISTLLDIIQTQKDQMATLQLELSSSSQSESNTASLASLQESLRKALDSIVEKDETNKSLLREITSLREELQKYIKKQEASDNSYKLLQVDIRKKEKENNSLTKRLNKALDKILDLQSQGKLDKKERYGKSSLKGIRSSKPEPRDREQEKDDYDGTPGSENGGGSEGACTESSSTNSSTNNIDDLSNNPNVKRIY